MRRVCIGTRAKSCDQVTTGGTRCPECMGAARQERAARDQARGSSYARGYDRQHLAALARLRSHVRKTNAPCHLCGQPFVAISDVTADHLVPLVLGGTNEWSNYGPAHRSCNSRRGANEVAQRRASLQRAKQRGQAEVEGHGQDRKNGCSEHPPLSLDSGYTPPGGTG